MAGDRYFFPIKIEAGANKLVIDDGGLKTITVPPGMYYTHGDATLHAGGWKDLYTTIQALVNVAIAPATWSISPYSTPVGSKLEFSGLSITRSAPLASWRVVATGTTLDSRLLGLSSTGVSFSGSVATSPMTVLGRWQSYTLLDHEATDKRSAPSYEVYTSTEEIQPATRQVRARARRLIRTVEYEYVPALHVFGGKVRANAADYYEAAGMVQGDDHNAFEHFWDSASEGRDIIVQHGSLGDPPSSDDYEICVLSNPEQRRNLSSCIELMRAGGELYRVKFDLLVKESSYEY